MNKPAVQTIDIIAHNPLTLNPRLFWTSAILLVFGIVSGLIEDIADQAYFNMASDAFTVALFLLVMLGTHLKIIKPGTGLVILLSESLRNFYTSLIFYGVTNPHFPYANDELLRLLLVTCVFAAILGVGISKVFAMVYSVVGLIIQAAYMLIFRDSQYLQDQFLVNLIIMTGCMVFVYYYRSLLERVVGELKVNLETTSQLRSHLEILNELDRPFVAFGQNTAGLVHDFRNDISGIYITIQTMRIRLNQGRAPNEQDIAAIARSLAHLNQRIRKVQYVTDAVPDNHLELINLGDVIESALYQFAISPELRRRFDFAVSFSGRLELLGNRFDYLQIFENLVRNSCEAILSQHTHEPIEKIQLAGLIDGTIGTIGIDVQAGETEIKIEVSDSGPGISWCKNRNCDRACLNCDCFAVGRSTKPYGSGFGMVNILQKIRQLKGDFSIRTGDKGTAISIRIPRIQEGDPAFLA